MGDLDLLLRVLDFDVRYPISNGTLACWQSPLLHLVSQAL